MSLGLLANPIGLSSPGQGSAGVGSASSARIAESVTQNAHGFSAGNVLYRGASGYALARADASSTAFPVGIVESVTSSNVFVLVRAGSITLSGLTAGSVYYLSDSVSGGYDPNKPSAESSFEVPLFTATSTTVAEINIDTPEGLTKIANSDLATMLANTVKGNALETESTPQDIPFWQVIAEGAPGATTGQVLTWDATQSKYTPQDPQGVTTSISPTQITGTVIDWSAIAHNGTAIKTLTGSTTLTLSNTTSNDGKRIFLRIANPSTYTLSITGPIWPSGTAPTLSTGNKADIFCLHNVSSTVYGSVVGQNYSVDVTPPTVSSSTIQTDGASIVQVFSEPVYIGSGGNGGLTLSASGGAVTATYSAGSGTDTLTWTLSRAIQQGETVTVSYTQPGNGIEDAIGNDLVTYSGAAVTNSSTASNYLVDEGFESGSIPSGWSELNASGFIFYGDTGDIIEGAGSLYIAADSSSTNRLTYKPFTAGSSRSMFARMKIGTKPTATANLLGLRDSSGNIVCAFRILASGVGRLYVGTAESSDIASGSIPTGTILNIWIDYTTNGTSSTTGDIRITTGTTLTRPASATKTVTTATTLADAARVFCAGSYSFASRFDRVRVATSTIGDQ